MKPYRFAVLLTLALVVHPAAAQDEQGQILSADKLHRSVGPWKYHPGDDPAWAHPGFDDSAWESLIDPTFELEEVPQSGWTGIGWFRLHFATDSTLWNRPLVLAAYTRGAAEVYLDDRLLATFGKVGSSEGDEVSIRSSEPNPRLIFFSFAPKTHHVLAVRHSNFVAANFYKVGGPVAGVDFRLGVPSELTAEISEDIRAYTATQYAFTSIPLAFALLYALLFVFYREERNYLYFALLATAVAAMTFIDLNLELLTYSEQYGLQRRYLVLTAIFMMMMFLYFVYSLIDKASPRRFWVFLVIVLGLGVWGWLDPFDAFSVISLLGLVVLLEVLRTVVSAIWRKHPGAWIIGLGLLFFIAGTSYDLIVDLQWIAEIGDINNGYYYGFMGLLISMAVYLARDVARTNVDLQEQLVQVKALSEKTLEQERRAAQEETQRKLLEAAYQQKVKELEEARALQLSMLPNAVPDHPDVQLAAYMETATEVGGDYYDFAVDADGTLTVAVGDATGHGMKAGTMVTAAKSLFNVLAGEADLLHIFDRSTRALKRLNLDQLYMALTLARFKEGQLRIAAAGMPPALLYRAADGKVEKIILKGMPLGSFVKFPYQEAALTVYPGDTVLFMSDGFPERFNGDRAMLGYEAAAEVFARVAETNPEAIIEHLLRKSEAWSDGQPLDDDMTFVVMKVRGAK